MDNTHSSSRPYRVCLFGLSLETGNMGCRALGASLIRLIGRVRPEAHIALLEGAPRSYNQPVRTELDQSVTVHVVHYRQSPRARLRDHLAWITVMALLCGLAPIPSLRAWVCRRIPFLQAISEADFVGAIYGGDSFSDIYGRWRFFIESLPIFMALALGKPLVLLPQTYGPYNSRIARWMARIIVPRAAVALARDGASLEVARQLRAGRGEPVRLCPDVAFDLIAFPPETLEIDPPLRDDTPTPLVGVNINGLLFMGGYSGANEFGLKGDYRACMESLVAALLDAGARVMLTPHTFGPATQNDQDACRAVFEKFAGRPGLHLITGRYDQHAIKAIIGGCDFFVGARMHACIAALSQGIPCVGVAYSGKFAGVFATVGAGHMVLDARELDGSELLDQCMRRFHRRADEVPDLRAQVARAVGDLRKVFSGLLEE